MTYPSKVRKMIEIEDKVNAFDLLLGKKKKRTRSMTTYPYKRQSSTTFSPKEMTRKPKMTQLCLDLGQKDFEKRSTCSLCGMVYIKDLESDEKDHFKFCQNRKTMARTNTWENARVVHRFLDDSVEIVEIRPGDPGFYLAKVRELKRYIDEDIGIVVDDFLAEKFHYLYVSRKIIVGYICVETIQEAFPVAQSQFILECQSVAQKALLGVNQMWVDSDYRRQSIATKLLDTIRCKHIYGYNIPLHQIAFTQLTHLGKKFAENYVSPHFLLIYKSKCSY